MKLTKNDVIGIFLLMLIFWLGVLRQVELPGLYMDAVNPDYLAAQTLNPGLQNPAWVIPTAVFPILGSLYHGVQNYYVDLITFRLLGVSVTSVRISQALFGAATVALLYLITVLATRNRIAAFIGAALLATDIAFIASFRTQFYIILGGEMWLFASLAALWYGSRIGFFLSGMFLGLATYGYFVLGFFGPAMLILMLSRPDRKPAVWILGCFVGVLPYVAGYASLESALGGFPQAIEWLRHATQDLAPLSSKLSAWASLKYTLSAAYLAITNAGNEFMIFGQSVGGIWGTIKAGGFIAVFLVAIALLKRERRFLVFLLPISYLIFGIILGSRLWAHHFSVLVPVAYLLLAMTLAEVIKSRSSIWIATACALVFFAGNLHQGDNFYRKLRLTGGTNLTTAATTTLANDALSEPKTLYVFPDWGFFMPFVLLTENRIPYVLETGQIDKSKCQCDRVRVAFWKASDASKYNAALTEKGLHDVETKTYNRIDGAPAFYVTTGVY
ncbi:MAG: glycosyltransferase family 39 protein [Pseudomonadota bacterium]|uniref:glycosyltransferase family 39 protein n=1 Tax=Burkholderia sp. 4M9327F10 TaxID=2502223 RepID=UPI0010F874CD|nr:glycosyltransferase family 39 protein [Burkholderia sp. 4M9327F10]